MRLFAFQIHVSVLNYYPGVPSMEVHPDVTAHLQPVGGGCCHSLPVPLMMPHLSSSCRETSVSPEGAETPHPLNQNCNSSCGYPSRWHLLSACCVPSILLVPSQQRWVQALLLFPFYTQRNKPRKVT